MRADISLEYSSDLSLSSISARSEGEGVEVEVEVEVEEGRDQGGMGNVARRELASSEPRRRRRCDGKDPPARAAVARRIRCGAVP